MENILLNAKLVKSIPKIQISKKIYFHVSTWKIIIKSVHSNMSRSHTGYQGDFCPISCSVTHLPAVNFPNITTYKITFSIQINISTEEITSNSPNWKTLFEETFLYLYLPCLTRLTRLVKRQTLMTNSYKWATTWQNLSSGVFDQARHKPACTATEAS